MLHRPYVLAFLAAFLWLSVRHWGWRRTWLWLLSGYTIAWMSEASSIRTGFPYGWYFYKYEHLTRDWLFWGVPVWDSLSYPFLIFAGYCVGEWYRRRTFKPPLATRLARLLDPVALRGACFTMLLDVIIDPVAHLGDRWFLGDIYAYTVPGWYFGVPMSNFAGWFLVAWLVIRLNRLWGAPLSATPPSRLTILFYFSIAAFNVGITWWVRAYPLAAVSTSLMLLIAASVGRQALRGATKKCCVTASSGKKPNDYIISTA